MERSCPCTKPFTPTLAEQHATTMAGLVRRMAEEDGWLGRVHGEVWMAGANAMTPAERRTVERLIRAGKGMDLGHGRLVRAQWHGSRSLRPGGGAAGGMA